MWGQPERFTIQTAGDVGQDMGLGLLDIILGGIKAQTTDVQLSVLSEIAGGQAFSSGIDAPETGIAVVDAEGAEAVAKFCN